MQGRINIYDVHIFVLKTELNQGYLPYKFFEVNPPKYGSPTSVIPQVHTLLSLGRHKGVRGLLPGKGAQVHERRLHPHRGVPGGR